MTTNTPIHTLNARDHILLEVLRDFFKLGPAPMQLEIQALRLKVEQDLAKKGISYSRLKTSLVPDRKRREMALVFDTTAISSFSYGHQIFDWILPLLDRKGNHSILHGDYLDRPGQAHEIFSAFEESVELRRNVDFLHPTQFFIVYLNNLTDTMVNALDAGLSAHVAYVGYADTTFTSKFKLYISTMLSNLCIKHGSIIIQGHEPDRSDTDDVNVSGYPFENYGYTCRSVNGDLMGVLLSYKIERPVMPNFQVDTEFSLNAISLDPLPLDNFVVEVTEAKLAYVNENKQDSLLRAGIDGISATELAELIKAKISASYIYNLDFLPEFNVAKFNILVELRSPAGTPTRLLAALEYIPSNRLLKLLTLF